MARIEFSRTASLDEMAREIDRRGEAIEKLERTIEARERRISRLVIALEDARRQGLVLPGDLDPPLVASEA